MEEARQVIESNKNDMKSVRAVNDYLQQLLSAEGRANWKAPPKSLFGTKIRNYLEEMFHMALIQLVRGAKCVTFRLESYKKTTSFLFFAASQLRLLDQIPLSITSVFMCTEQFDILIPFFLQTKNEKALQSILTSHADTLTDKQIISCIKPVVHNKEIQNFCLTLLSKIKNQFPSDVAKIESYCLFDKTDPDTFKRSLDILETALEKDEECKKDYILLYDASLLSIYNRDLSKARRYIYHALQIYNESVDANILSIRLVEDPTHALLKVRNSRQFVGDWNKDILLEGLRIAAMTDQIHFFEEFHRKLVKRWPDDPNVCEKIMSICFMANKLNEATQAFNRWSKIENKTAAYYYYSAQRSISNGSMTTAESSIEKAILLDPLKSEYHATLALILKKMKRDNTALHVAKRATEIGPLCAPAWKAYSLIATGNEAAEALQKFNNLQDIRVIYDDLDLLL